MTRIAVTADLHADDFLTRVDPATGLNARFQDIIGSIRWVGEHARQFECEALVVAGDYTESKTPARSPRVVKIAQALASGPDRQIHMLGNHDGSWHGESIVTDLARTQGWTGFTQPGIELVDGVALCAIPYLDRRWIRTQPGFETIPDAELFRVLSAEYLTIARGLFVAAEAAGARASILVGHQQLSGGRMTEKQQAFLGDYDVVVDTGALQAIGFAAITFGHVHKAQVLAAGDRPVMFAGSIERVDFAEELEQKSFLVVDVDDAGNATVEQVPIPARHYLTIRGNGSFNDAAAEDSVVRAIDLDPDVDETELRRALVAAGAFEVVQVTRRPVDAPEVVGGIDETLSPEAALEEYFADDPDRDALVELGREILTAVA